MPDKEFQAAGQYQEDGTGVGFEHAQGGFGADGFPYEGGGLDDFGDGFDGSGFDGGSFDDYGGDDF